MAEIYETNKNVDPICVRNSSRVEKLSNRGDKRSFPICATSPRFGVDPTASRDAQKQTERDDARVLARKIPVLFPTSPSNRADATLSRSRVFFVCRTRAIASLETFLERPLNKLLAEIRQEIRLTSWERLRAPIWELQENALSYAVEDLSSPKN